MSAPFAIGDLIGGRYQLSELLLSNPTADVWRADDLSLTRPVALHVMPFALAHDAAFLADFRDVAVSVASLNHPHVLRVFDWGEEAGGAYLVTEFPAGGSLRSRLDVSGPLSESQAALLGAEVADGLAYAHARGITHGALSPSTIHFDADGRAKIADLGIAGAIARSSMGPTTDVRYASPEQAQRQLAGAASDVYALALILFESLTGEVPHDRGAPLETLTARIGAPMPSHPAIKSLDMVLAQGGAYDASFRLDAGTLASRLGALAGTPVMPSSSPRVAAPTLNAPTPFGTVSDKPVAARRLDFEPPTADQILTSAPLTPPPATLLEGIDSARDSREPSTAANQSFEHVTRTPRRRRLLRTLAGAVVLVAALVVGGGYGLGWFTPTHPMPNVVGLSQADALSALSPYNITLKITGHSFSSSVASGLIATQSVATGTSVKDGATVEATMSEGPEPVTIPTSVIGADCASATATLQHLGLHASCPSTSSVASSTVPKDHVVRVRYGTQVNPVAVPTGASLVLILSAGPTAVTTTTTPTNSTLRTLPNLVGESRATVYATMRQLGLYFVTSGPGSNNASWTKVVSQRPGANAQVKYHSTVYLKVTK